MALVTGGAGFVGSHLTDRLVADGWSVRVLDDFSSGRERNLERCAGSAEVVRGDLRDESLLDKALRDVEVVFHQAAVPSVPRSVAEPLRTNDVNVTGTLRLLEAARRAEVRRVVFAASSSAYGDTPELPKVESMPANPRSPYALQKFAGEVYCRLYTSLYGLETVALRYFNVFGPRQDPDSEYAAVIPKFVKACLTEAPPCIYGDGEQTRDFTFVRDVVRANLLAADSRDAVGTVVNVAGGERISLNRLLAHVKEITGSKVEAVRAAPRPGDVRDSLADLRRAAELLGYKPAVEVRQGLLETIDYFRKVLEGAAAG
ncbi:MAG TPA: SDR family oxidoreductase [Longimicrobiales bacterium]|nr:SDR family oxidoreductase [Longimicrobiales bacterium]